MNDQQIEQALSAFFHAVISEDRHSRIHPDEMAGTVMNLLEGHGLKIVEDTSPPDDEDDRSWDRY